MAITAYRSSIIFQVSYYRLSREQYVFRESRRKEVAVAGLLFRHMSDGPQTYYA